MALIACLATAALCHFHAHARYVDRLDTTETLYPRGQVGASAPSQPVAERVWVLIIDGLRADRTGSMPALKTLASQGVQRVLIAEFPSYTYANLTALVTGIPPFYSGVRLNSGKVVQRYDTLLAAAARSGVTRIVVSMGWKNFDRALDAAHAPAAEHLTLAQLLASGRGRQLAWIHIEDVDKAGHMHGARTSAYREATATADRLVAQLAAATDMDRDALIVLSDHGHLDRGGHGGAEPDARRAVFVAAGRGLRRNRSLPPAPLRDVCSTIAVLAGIPPPVDNLGAPMIDALDADRLDVSHALSRIAQQRRDADGRAAEPATSRELVNRRRRRMPLAAAAALLCLAVWLVPRWRPRSRDGIPLAIFIAVFAIGYVACGYRLSWSLPRGYAAFIGETALVGGVAMAASVFAARMRMVAGDPRHPGAQASYTALVLAVYAVAVGVSGSDPTWMETPRRSFVLVLVATAAFYAALALAVCALFGLPKPRST